MECSARVIVQRRLSKDGSIHVTDEVYNTLISSLGAALSSIGIVALLVITHAQHKPWHFLGFSIYGVGLLLMFITSALHHGIDSTVHINHLLRRLDYYAIPIMIAGTFTPHCLVLLRHGTGFGTLVLVWTLAIGSILLQIKFPQLPKWITTMIFLAMGWLGLVIFVPLYQIQGWNGVRYLFYGGVFFSVGAMIYHFEWPNLIRGKFGFHEIWHACVLTGAAMHFAQMVFVVLPSP